MRAPLTVALSGLIYSTHIFFWSLLYVPSFHCLCLLEASRRPGLLLRGATGALGRVLCSSCAVLLVTGARRARVPPTGSEKAAVLHPFSVLVMK